MINNEGSLRSKFFVEKEIVGPKIYYYLFMIELTITFSRICIDLCLIGKISPTRGIINLFFQDILYFMTNHNIIIYSLNMMFYKIQDGRVPCAQSLNLSQKITI
jgi:hypothetical protein